jgi:hypothetical protein
MAEEEESNPSVQKEPSRGDHSCTRPPRQPPNPAKEDSKQGPRQTRPGRSERQRQNKTAEKSGQLIQPGPSTMNPSAPEFVARQKVFMPVAPTNSPSTDAHANRRPRGGRRGEHTINENVPPKPGPSEPTKNTAKSHFHVKPTVIKESEDLTLRMTEALSKNEYDCSICTDSVFQVNFRLIEGSTLEPCFGLVKFAGQSFTDHVYKSGHLIPWEKE